MTPTATALLGYVLWTIILLLTLEGLRAALTLSGKRAVNNFDPSGKDVSEFSARLCRAHANCYESFVFVGGPLLYALATGATAVTDPLAYALLAARIGQSLVHIASTSVPAVFVRFTLFFVQQLIVLWWLYGFVIG